MQPDIQGAHGVFERSRPPLPKHKYTPTLQLQRATREEETPVRPMLCQDEYISCAWLNISRFETSFLPPSSRPFQVLLLAGPDKGKTGYVIGMEGGSMASTKAIVKLETSSALGMREIKVRK